MNLRVDWMFDTYKLKYPTGDRRKRAMIARQEISTSFFLNITGLD